MSAKDGLRTRYADKVVGTLGCYDRLVLSGTLMATTFDELGDSKRAQEMSDGLSVFGLHQKLEAFGRRYCPPCTQFYQGYPWSVMPAEYALDLVFKRAEDLKPIDDEISRQALPTVRIDELARFWDKRLSPKAQAATRFSRGSKAPASATTSAASR